MTTVTLTKQNTSNTKSILITWLPLANGDVGSPMPFSQYADKSVQVVGTFGVGGSVVIEGSNNGTDYAPLTDPQGNDLNITGAKIEMVSEATLYIRPRVTAGDGSTSISVILFGKE